MGFSGTTTKCTAYDKTVHFIDLIKIDGISYHKTCFRCSRCNGRLVMSNYRSMEGVLYCKPHFEQLFKEFGCNTKNFQTRKSEKQKQLTRSPSRLAPLFSGTQDKCGVCNKTAYPLEKVTVEGEHFHKSCFRCSPAPLHHHPMLQGMASSTANTTLLGSSWRRAAPFILPGNIP
ncbi:hypothetical protein V6N11_010926 [Hibiscus sabdariffa]|uniref:LIM zinc-binding domain-containing protein n=1 Tax=Hibiscus sabdariffa TaxID=183260 RepID=A0ABR2S7K3_9ROSI